MPIQCTVGILTHNSADFLERSLKSLEGFGEILIADGGSTDSTLEIARRFGCTIIQQSKQGVPISDFALERNRMMDAARFDWFFYLDSDEIISEGLKFEIGAVTAVEKPQHLVYRVPYRIMSKDTLTVYRSFKPYYQHRFFNRRSGARFQRKVHERAVFDAKTLSVGTLAHPWYVTLDIQLDFGVYKSKVDHRIRIMVAERPPRSLVQYARRVILEPMRNILKQLIKFVYLRARYSSRELTPGRYELYKLYSQWVHVRENTRAYGRSTARRMRHLAKHALYLVAYGMRLLIKPGSEVCVLMYHSIGTDTGPLTVSPDEFDRQMRWIAQKKKVCALDAVVDHVKGSAVMREGVSITFDDGYRDLIEIVEPILKRYELTATVFVPSDISVPTTPLSTPRLSWQDMLAMQERGTFCFESHGRTHRPLTKLSHAEMLAELTDSRSTMEKELGRRPHYFAYPYGARNIEAQEAVVEAGYDAAFAITEGMVTPRTDICAIKRVQVDKSITLPLFKMRLTSAVDIHRQLLSLIGR